MSSLFGSGQTSQEKQLTGAETGLVQQATAAGQFGTSTAESLIPQGTQLTSQQVSTLQPVLQYFQSLMSGNPATVAAAESPQVSQISKQYEAAQQSTDTFAPRGGGATAANAESRFGEAGQIAGLLTGAQGTGVQGTTSIASLLAQLGQSLSGTGISALAGGAGSTGSAISGASSIVGQLQSSQQMVQQNQAAAGSAIGSLVALLAA